MRLLALASASLLVAHAVVAVEPPGAARPALRFGVVSFYNPRLMYIKYQPLVDYLSSATGQAWELVIGASYERTVEDLCAGRLAVAYLGPYSYARANAACGALPVVKLNTDGKSTYRSVIMVRKDSTISSLKELAGKRFGFGSPMSTSSHVMPRAMLEDAGLHPGADFTCRYYFHHERAARAVLLGEVDACGIRDIVGEKFTHRELRVLATSDGIPNFPFVVGPKSPPELREELLRALVTRPAVDPAVAATIRSWDEELAGGFVPATDADYAPVRLLAVRVFGPNALTLRENELECGPGRE
ncbi:MAG TPA: phosphate/phosphite/phosphonate ABC transporter substrate-binding protein [Thermoanaerobaculaceae bacterium]|nr:phosphate/phosphite/phosphonate ABC transporter substrate-binding protein [Thermoanaerobaculaceae bacterium]HQU32694.1 phosphate/phosphite/phosphonate ABC transporter substrate-binding protein [Thermoanaerobaculaceae bacterium]